MLFPRPSNSKSVWSETLRSLSLKIFLWFCLAIAVSATAFILAALFFPSQTLIVQAKNFFTYKVTNAGQVAVRVYEQDGPEALARFLERLHDTTSFKLYLLNSEGTGLNTSDLPAGAMLLTQKALSADTLQITKVATQPLVARKLLGKDHRVYVVMLQMPYGMNHFTVKMFRPFAIRIVAALLASVVVCLLMTRYLTAPIRKLKAAVRRLSQGDLHVRVAEGLGRRKDEIAALGQDFDTMASRIESLMKAQERLFREIAHELRSPLTRLNVALEICRKHTDEHAKRFLDRIALETDKLSLLITQLLTLSRLDNADVTLQKKPVALEKLIGRIAQDANFEGEATNCAVVFKCRNTCTLPADGNLLRSAIENVIRNALRFAPNGTRVEVTQSIRKDNTGAKAVVCVRDFGPGVPPGSLKDLFKPFFRADEVKGRTSESAGLGLAIAMRAVHMHNGLILARNADDGGLVVEIRLPVKKNV
jgi:two-component system sensor histidine kinase CpxA